MIKKIDKTSALLFGSVMGIFYIIQNITYLGMPWAQGIIIGIGTGIGTGFLFGLFMGLYKNSKTYTKKTKIETAENEIIVFQTFANCNFEEGKLYLTNQKLIFKSVYGDSFTAKLSDISRVERCKTLGLFNNGILITTIHNKNYKFAVEQPENWVAKINNKEEFVSLS